MFSPQAVNQRVDAYRGNPQALMQKYAVSQDLLDLLALQQINKEKTEAARQMQLQMAKTQGAAPPSVAEQLEQETVAMTRQDMANKLAPMAQMQQQQVQQRAKMMGGIASNPAPNMSAQALAKGGIVGFQAGGNEGLTDSEVEEEDQPKTSGQRMLRDLSLWLNSVAGAERERRMEQLRTSYPAQIVNAIAGFEAGPKITYKPADGAPSIYADENEGKKYRGIEVENQPEKDMSAPMPDGGAPTVSPQEYDETDRLLARYPAPPTPGMQSKAKGEKGVTDQQQDSGTQDVGLASLAGQNIRKYLAGDVDNTMSEEFGRTFVKPYQDIQARRQADLISRATEAQRIRDMRLAAMEDKTPGWLDYLQRSAASGAKGPMAGLQALSMGAVSQRDAQKQSAFARAEEEAKYQDLRNKFIDLGYTSEEASLNATKAMYGERAKEYTTAQESKQKVTEAMIPGAKDGKLTESQWAFNQYQTIKATSGQAAADAFMATWNKVKGGRAAGLTQQELFSAAKSMAEAKAKEEGIPFNAQLVKQMQDELIKELGAQSGATSTTGTTMPKAGYSTDRAGVQSALENIRRQIQTQK